MWFFGNEDYKRNYLQLNKIFVIIYIWKIKRRKFVI